VEEKLEAACTWLLGDPSSAAESGSPFQLSASEASSHSTSPAPPVTSARTARASSHHDPQPMQAETAAALNPTSEAASSPLEARRQGIAGSGASSGGADHDGNATARSPADTFASAVAFCQGNGVPKDIGLAMQLLQSAAEQGHGDALAELGALHLAGTGVPKDLDRAAKLLEAAVEQGHAKAQFVLGRMHLHGRGVPKDLDRGAKLLEAAVEQGHEKAQFVLGHMHLHGRGVPRDATKARELLELAAAQGSMKAQAALDKLECVEAAHSPADGAHVCNSCRSLDLARAAAIAVGQDPSPVPAPGPDSCGSKRSVDQPSSPLPTSTSPSVPSPSRWMPSASLPIDFESARLSSTGHDTPTHGQRAAVASEANPPPPASTPSAPTRKAPLSPASSVGSPIVLAADLALPLPLKGAPTALKYAPTAVEDDDATSPRPGAPQSGPSTTLTPALIAYQEVSQEQDEQDEQDEQAYYSML